MRWPSFSKMMQRGVLAGALCAALGAMAPVRAADAAANGVAGFGAPVGAETLDGARGGFEIAGGLSVALGIERVVSVNGEILSRTNIAIPDLAALSADQARLTQEALGAARMIQIGGNNFAAADLNLPNGATLVQNTLDNQAISSVTTITSAVNSMSLLKDMNFHSTIRDAVVRSPGTL
ncbi:hypothetical protein ABIB38_000657 [Massilia sp. UYP11]|uniref:hypothetical protein n=1 Tax=Massilia sp. UYP11 TaxID=1756385 RepID=UPI003D195210